MTFIKHQGNALHFKQIFNQQHASMIIQQQVSRHPNFTQIQLHNVGIKITKDIFQKFQQYTIQSISLYYNWNEIMMMPKLVCYDKNTWKTLQQLTNWNRQWSLIFRPCFGLKNIQANIVISWADQQFVKAFLEGLNTLPNLQQVTFNITCKNYQKVEQMLNAFKQAKIFPFFKYQCHKFDENLYKTK